jgi:hypothetical protein
MKKIGGGGVAKSGENEKKREKRGVKMTKKIGGVA